MVNKLIANHFAIEDLRSSLREGESGLKYLPITLKRVLREESWRRRIVQDTGQEVGFDSFADFVTADPLGGLGSDIDQIKKLLEHDTEALVALDKEIKNPTGRPRVIGYIVPNKPGRPGGNTRQKALRRLRKDPEHADLLARVEAGELSVHAAAVQAGFRKKTATFRVDDPEVLAQSLVRKLDPDDLRALVKYLSEAVAG